MLCGCKCANVRILCQLQEGRPLTKRNELAAYRSLQITLQAKVAKYPTRYFITSCRKDIDANHRLTPTILSISDDARLLKASDIPPRKRSGIRLRMEDKLVLTQMISTLSNWIRAVEQKGIVEAVPKTFTSLL